MVEKSIISGRIWRWKRRNGLNLTVLRFRCDDLDGKSMMRENEIRITTVRIETTGNGAKVMETGWQLYHDRGTGNGSSR
ncbi:MAG: hypothetical protein ACLR2O_02640 [Coprococcus sp.]